MRTRPCLTSKKKSLKFGHNGSFGQTPKIESSLRYGDLSATWQAHWLSCRWEGIHQTLERQENHQHRRSIKSQIVRGWDLQCHLHGVSWVYFWINHCWIWEHSEMQVIWWNDISTLNASTCIPSWIDHVSISEGITSSSWSITPFIIQTVPSDSRLHRIGRRTSSMVMDMTESTDWFHWTVNWFPFFFVSSFCRETPSVFHRMPCCFRLQIPETFEQGLCRKGSKREASMRLLPSRRRQVAQMWWMSTPKHCPPYHRALAHSVRHHRHTLGSSQPPPYRLTSDCVPLTVVAVLWSVSRHSRV